MLSSSTKSGVICYNSHRNLIQWCYSQKGWLVTYTSEEEWLVKTGLWELSDSLTAIDVKKGWAGITSAATFPGPGVYPDLGWFHLAHPLPLHMAFNLSPGSICPPVPPAPPLILWPKKKRNKFLEHSTKRNRHLTLLFYKLVYDVAPNIPVSNFFLCLIIKFYNKNIFWIFGGYLLPTVLCSLTILFSQSLSKPWVHTCCWVDAEMNKAVTLLKKFTI